MHENISTRIVEALALPRIKLAAEYKLIFGKVPPKNISYKMLQRVVCYELQLRAAGGLTTEQQRLFVRCIDSDAPTDRIWNNTTQIKSGTRFRRLWKGKSYEVVAEDKGFRLDGALYNSLSEAARTITGTRWNGHVFFGLRDKPKGVSHAATA